MIQKPRGTQDYFADEFFSRRELENKFITFYTQKGYWGMETPIFEQKNLFVRTVGEETEIVQKELFDLEKKSDEIYSLRPEFTAGMIRSLIEKGIKSMPLPVKIMSVGPCFRYERPQKGRKRQFNQLDTELIGKKSPGIDAEYIASSVEFLSSVGVKNLVLTLNDFGSTESRLKYAGTLNTYLKNSTGLCELCRNRVQRNPLRVLDCKDEKCRKIIKLGPKIVDCLTSDEKKYFDETVVALKELLKGSLQPVLVDPFLVRGLDYYTGIVFEISVKGDESRMNSIGGGGRYDGLIRELGGPDMPAIGCGLGFERIVEHLTST